MDQAFKRDDFMKCRLTLTAVLALMGCSAASASALDSPVGPSVLFNNSYDDSIQVGACDWNTACGTGSAISPGGYFGDDFAAQAFSLAAPALITAASATELADYSYLNGINWAFYKADGIDGLPGEEIASGFSQQISNITGFDDFGDAVVEDDFPIDAVNLAAGDYYFAVQGISSDPTQVDNYLAQGVLQSGAAETMDGGLSWVANYASDPRSGYISSVAVGLYGFQDASAVPESSSWIMMILGFGAIGSLIRNGYRRSNERSFSAAGALATA